MVVARHTVVKVFLAAEAGSIGWQEEILVPVRKAPYNGIITATTAGRLRFNEEMPPEVDFVNDLLGDKQLKALIEKVYKEKGPWLTVQMLDAIKSVGYRYATFFGATISMDDILIPDEKSSMIANAGADVDRIRDQYNKGVITDEERYNQVCDIWAKKSDELTEIMMDKMKRDKDGFNTIYMMADSGARGSKNQIRQLAGMRGLMAKPNGQIIELPILSNFKEGLSVFELFISTNGASKGLYDTALKKADSGFLTRRLVDFAQDVVVNEDD